MTATHAQSSGDSDEPESYIQQMQTTHATALAVWVIGGMKGKKPPTLVLACRQRLAGVALGEHGARELLNGKLPEHWPLACPKCAVLVDAAMAGRK